MNQSISRSGSRRFGTGSGYYGHVGEHEQEASPFSTESVHSPLYDSTPTHDVQSSYFGFHPVSPRAAASLVDLNNFSFKRLRSLDSGLIESTDASPVSRSSKASKTGPNHIVVSRMRMPEATYHSTSPSSTAGLDRLPMLKLGDDGRAKLKSALSELAKQDTDIRARIDAIGKIRLASIQQLMRMAKVAGLWEYAQSLARDHDVAKTYRRST